MERRQFLSGVGSIGVVGALAGCSNIPFIGGDPGPPPRKAAVFERVNFSGGTLSAQLDSEPWVESRADVDAEAVESSFGNPAANAKGGGAARGGAARGGGVGGVAAGTHGRAKHRKRDDDDEWRDNNEDELEQYAVAITTVGISRMRGEDAEEENLPGPGPADSWDETWSDVSGGQSISHNIDRQGWYRVGAEVEAQGDSHGFGWEAVDLEIEDEGSGLEAEEKWTVSPSV